jgi:beta-mannosidase
MSPDTLIVLTGCLVWHGTQEKYQIFDTLGGRFNSEFGMEAFPHIDTIKYYCTDPSQLYPQSHMLDFHNKADGHERRIATYLVENFRTKTDLEVRTVKHARILLGCCCGLMGHKSSVNID